MNAFKGLLICALLFSGSQCTATTWYIRPDGGDRSQCTGLADAAYSATKFHQACAFRHPNFLFVPDRIYGEKPKWLVAAGDTVIIKNGSYRMGYKGPQPHDFWQFCPGDPYGCHMPSLPSGSPEHHTRFLGEEYKQCAKKPILFGGYGLDRVLDLSGSAYIDVQCVEITDHASCSRVGNFNACRTDYPIDDYASNGIITNQRTHDIRLEDLDIHGLAANGIMGPVGDHILANKVRIAGNSAAGWNFDDGSDTPSSGAITLTYVTVEWNGCAEEARISDLLPYDNCADDNSGGYGDGVGTANSSSAEGWHWNVSHSVFRYNTQDGLDLLHVFGANSTETIVSSMFYGNMGNQIKLGAGSETIFRNNMIVGNCQYLSVAHRFLPPTYNAHLSDFCRALGDAMVVVASGSTNEFIQNNSAAGDFHVVFYIQCAGSCNPKPHVHFDNNLVYGFSDRSGQHAKVVGLYDEKSLLSNERGTANANLFFGVNEQCPREDLNRTICGDPHLASERKIDDIDFDLTAASPAIAAGTSVPEVLVDITGFTRTPSRMDIGAYAYKGPRP